MKSVLLSCLAVVALAAGARAEEPDASAIAIELRGTAAVANRLITVGDVAVLKGGNIRIRNRIAEIELADVPPPGQTTVVKSRQVEYRLLLADIPKSTFRMSGSSDTVVSGAREPISADLVLKTAREALLRRMPWPEEDLSIVLLRPIALQLPMAGEWESPTLKAEPHSATVGIGRSEIDVSIYVNGERKLSLPVYFETKLLQKVAICLSQVKKGETLTEQNTYADRRPFDTGTRTVIPYESVIGKKVNRTMTPGQVVASIDLDSESAGNGSVLVHARQPVKLLVRVGAMAIATTGEALQEGRLGQTVRVQNLDSKKVVSGRVTGQATVEVETGGNP
jgi:flagella basal body P-ring formation protein FlgA